MPETITKAYEGQIIAGIFSDRENADRAALAFRELGILEKNIQEVIQSDEKQAVDGETSLVDGHGFSKTQAVYYASALGAGLESPESYCWPSTQFLAFQLHLYTLRWREQILETFEEDQIESAMRSFSVVPAILFFIQGVAVVNTPHGQALTIVNIFDLMNLGKIDPEDFKLIDDFNSALHFQTHYSMEDVRRGTQGSQDQTAP